MDREPAVPMPLAPAAAADPPAAAVLRRLSVALALLIGLALAVLQIDPTARPRRTQASMDEIKGVIERRYYREVDDRELEIAAIRGMLGTLDPYSSFMSVEEARAFREDTEGRFAGLGIEITVEKGYVTVITPIEETPAFAAGILPGDRIIAIDGEPREFASTDDAARVLRGRPGTRVTLTIVHEGAAAPEDVTLVRREIDVKSVKRPRLLEEDPRVGYIRVTQFRPGTAADVRTAATGLLARGAKALVLDLRSNPGGLLDEAVDVVDLFVEDGLIVRTVGRDASSQTERFAKKEGTLPPCPMAVIVNGGSASAAEVVAGALKDLGRAIIVGTRSHGKGSVQTLLQLADGSLLKLTTAHYFTRSGRPIHREADAKESDPWGVMPDVPVELDPRKLAEIFRRRDGLDFYAEGRAPRGEEEKPVPDPQVAAAVKALAERMR